MSPDGVAQAQVLGTWAKGARPSFSLGRETYQNGKWIEITYGRPLQRGRDLFGSGDNYGKAASTSAAGFPAPPVWRAGANVTTRLKTEATLMFGDKKVRAGEYSLFIDLKPPRVDADHLELGRAGRNSTRRTRTRCGARTATRRTRTSRACR